MCGGRTRCAALCGLVGVARSPHEPRSDVRPPGSPDTTVTVLGDGEFDGTELQSSMRARHWQHVCQS
jgi:hypothetical protein